VMVQKTSRIGAEVTAPIGEKEVGEKENGNLDVSRGGESGPASKILSEEKGKNEKEKRHKTFGIDNHDKAKEDFEKSRTDIIYSYHHHKGGWIPTLRKKNR